MKDSEMQLWYLETMMNESRRELTRKLLKIPDVTEKIWPDRDDGISSIMYKNKELAHFHNDNELDIRLGKKIIKSQNVRRLADSKVHPNRATGSSWIELRFHNQKEVAEAIRLIKLALAEI